MDEGDLAVVHDRAYTRRIMALAEEGLSQEEMDRLAGEYDSVQLCRGSPTAATSAASCARHLAELIAERKIPNAFSLTRPPGHHALHSEANGFCIFNNSALAGHSALDFGAQRVLIVDFDAHHGQGVQRAFYDDKRVLYFSVHRYQRGRFWPHLEESNFDYIGEGAGKGFNVNVPLNEVGD